jgi:hypothetical protein
MVLHVGSTKEWVLKIGNLLAQGQGEACIMGSSGSAFALVTEDS